MYSIARPQKKEQLQGILSQDRHIHWRLLASIFIFVIVLTTLPYLYGYLTTQPDKQFMGIMVNVPDHAQYFSWMRELSQNNLSSNKLTPEANDPLFFNLLWWCMGRFGKLFSLNYAHMFQILRIIGTALFLWVSYRICLFFLENRAMAFTALALIVFGGGFGWILIVLKYVLGLQEAPLPLLIYTPEPNTFFNILAFPHFIAAATYIFIFYLVLQGQIKQKLRYAIVSGVIALFLGWQHAYDLILVYGILSGYIVLLCVRDRRLPTNMIKALAIIILLSCWPALYSVMLTSLSPMWKQILDQFDNAGVYTPNPLYLIILLGPAFLLALYTIFKNGFLRLDKDDKSLFLKSWFLSNFLLIYIPADYQIHMLNGFQVPIAILATMGTYYYIIPKIQNIIVGKRAGVHKEAVRRSVIIMLMCIVIPTNIYLYVWRFVELSRSDYPYFLYNDEVEALKWLESNADPDDVVISSYTIGHYIPMISGKKTFVAHWAQTLDFFEKREKLSKFFSSDTGMSDRLNTLYKFDVTYIFHGPAERLIGNFDPSASRNFTKMFSSSKVDIFRVNF